MLSIPWLSKRRVKSGRIGLAIGPDGWAVACIDAGGRLTYSEFHNQPANSRQLLADLVAEHGWQDIPCSVVLHPVYYQLLLAETPPVEVDELPAAIRWKIKELLDYPLEEAAIEHFLLPDDAYRGRQKMLYAAALRKTALQDLIDPVEVSGLQVDCVEIAELALHNIISRMPREGGGIALVQLHEGEGFINLVEDGAIYLTRHLDIGLEKFTMEGNNTVFFDSLSLEIQRSLDYYESQLGKGIITRLFYSPGLTETAAIGEFLSAQLGLNVAPLDLSAFDLLEGGLFGGDLFEDEVDEQALRCISAIGVALGPCKELELVSAAS